MKSATKIKLKEAMDICDRDRKSTEYMIQYMQDFAGVDHDCVMDYLYSIRDKSNE